MDIGPSEKLSEVISNALGAWIAPWAMKRVAKAEAEADRIKAIEEAKTEALLANNEERFFELSAIEKRVVAKELKRQNNLAKIIDVAAQTIKDEKEVSSYPVNPDWATRFFDIAQDISDEAMQDLWGRILAGETKLPGSYSLRTLDTLRNITREEALLFERYAQYVFYDGTYYIYHESSIDNSRNNVKYEDIAQMMEVGLIQSGSMTSRYYFGSDETVTEHYVFNSHHIAIIEMPQSMPKMSIPVYQLSKIGCELYKLLTPINNLDYFLDVLRKIAKANRGVDIKYAELSTLDPKNGVFSYTQETLKSI